jgi:long-chain fatty acid transport protein
MKQLGSVFILAGLLLPTGSAWGQSDSEVNAAVQFNFSTPGARSVAMGGAFVASVDDATAAHANPAGLLQLSETEVLIEGRRWQTETLFADRGRASGPVTGIGVDTTPGVVRGVAEDEGVGISYAALVVPRQNWGWAAYYHRAADFEIDYSTGGVFYRTGRQDNRLFPVEARYDLRLDQAGIAGAWKWQNGVAVGLALVAQSLKLDSLTQRFDFAGFYQDPVFARGLAENFQTQQADATAFGLNVGFLWSPGQRLSTGVVARIGPKFDELSLTSGFGSPENARLATQTTSTFHVPDVVAAGLTFRPKENFSVTLDIQSISYSESLENFTVLLGSEPEDFLLEDAVEYHLGLEYVTTGLKVPIALRAGAWYDPEHRLKAVDTADPAVRILFFEGEDLVHGTAGLGISAGAFQLDLALDVSKRSSLAAVSLAFRF